MKALQKNRREKQWIVLRKAKLSLGGASKLIFARMRRN